MNGALPEFGLDQGGLVLALVRGLAVAALMSVFGTLLFRAWVAPRAWADLRSDAQEALDRRLRRWAWIGMAAAAVWLMLWLPVQTAAIAGPSTPARSIAAIGTVIVHLRFGLVLIAQLVCLLGTALALRFGGGVWAPVLCAGLALALQVGHSHAAADHPGLTALLLSDVVHLLAGGAWLGSLVPLLLMVRRAPAPIGAALCRRYSPMGRLCLAAMLASALEQAWELIGDVPGLLGTAYGWTALCKLALFLVLFGFALRNRYRLAPALLAREPERARRGLVTSIAWQSLAALAVVLAAGVLSQESPSIHTQPVWPFSRQFSLVTVDQDPDFAREVESALAMLAGGLLMLAVGLARIRRWSSLAWVAVSAVLIAAAVPHFDLLFIPATPASFYRSPTGFSAISIEAGARLYPPRCAACHGGEGRGDGPLAATLKLPPADLTAPHLWEHSDGEMFWWLAHGMAAPQGGLVMPGFSGPLSDDDLWALIDFVRARNAGLARRDSGDWPVPVQAPSFQMNCQDGVHPLAEQRGRTVRLVLGPAAAAAGVLTVTASPSTLASTDLCTVDDGALRRAYATVTGLPDAALSGVEVLIDGAGWLRVVHGGGPSRSWLTDAVQAIAERPIAAAAPVEGHHH